MTKKCAGPTAECRKAMLGILGTELRSNCACKGTELTQLYDCLGWQRLLWVNPCVGELILSSSSFFFLFFFLAKQFPPPGEKVHKILKNVAASERDSFFRFIIPRDKIL